MKTLPGSDASILAIFAQSPSVGIVLKEAEEYLMNQLSCDDTRIIARAIIAQDLNNPEAKAFIDWAQTLRSLK